MSKQFLVAKGTWVALISAVNTRSILYLGSGCGWLPSSKFGCPQWWISHYKRYYGIPAADFKFFYYKPNQ